MVNNYIDKVRSWFIKLSIREKVIVTTVIVTTLLIAFYNLVYFPMTTAQELLKNRIEVKKSEIVEMQKIADNIINIQSKLQQFDKKIQASSKIGSALSVIEFAISEIGIPKKNVSLSPSQTSELGGYTEELVLVKINNISLVEVVALLKLLREKNPIFRVKRLTVKQIFSNKDLLGASISIATYKIVP
ncbi:MAG: type II secretion system protein GspM [Nitrospinota bacterium]